VVGYDNRVGRHYCRGHFVPADRGDHLRLYGPHWRHGWTRKLFESRANVDTFAHTLKEKKLVYATLKEFLTRMDKGTMAQWAGATATFLAVLVALFKDELLRYLRKPKLTISIEMKPYSPHRRWRSYRCFNRLLLPPSVG
jgi:hypothetical protein